MLYDRKIKYLNYYEGGTKVNGGGFAKLELRGNTLRLELTIRGLHPTDSFERDIMLQGAEKEETLGQIRIQNGSGQFRYSCDADQEIGATGISYSELRGIRIPIGGTREILCQWDNVSDRRRIIPPEENIQKIKSGLRESGRESLAESYTGNKMDSEATVYTENEQSSEPKLGKTERAEVKTKEAEVKTKEAEVKTKEAKNKKYENIEDKDGENKNRQDKGRERQGDKENIENIVIKEKKEDKVDKKKDIENKESRGRGSEPLQTIFKAEEQSGERTEDKPAMVENRHAEQSDVKKAPVRLMEDKWQQLSAIYPHIQPFRDERDYLSLTPSDFVLFPDRFYRAVNNSFLLHGYYNYHHLILARIERRGEILYYIGVPGNYFEREKQVAIMFGFESFECETESAKTGDFGYYMMRTEL